MAVHLIGVCMADSDPRDSRDVRSRQPISTTRPPTFMFTHGTMSIFQQSGVEVLQEGWDQVDNLCVQEQGQTSRLGVRAGSRELEVFV
jgi:hypothetical protein